MKKVINLEVRKKLVKFIKGKETFTLFTRTNGGKLLYLEIEHNNNGDITTCILSPGDSPDSLFYEMPVAIEAKIKEILKTNK